MRKYFWGKNQQMIQKQNIQDAFKAFTQGLDSTFQLKSIFFDMDGVLFNSMPLHAKAWIIALSEYGINLPEHEPYMNEGSTAFYTVKQMFKKYLNQEASSEITKEIRNRKHAIMGTLPKSEIFHSMPDLLSQITEQHIDCWVVTGSAQEILIDRLVHEYPGSIFSDKIITGNDVKIGKPNPEPYLKAMEISGYKTHQVIVVENAPLGVESAKAAGLFTIAINTGPLDPNVLKEAGADLVFTGSEELLENWPVIYDILSN